MTGSRAGSSLVEFLVSTAIAGVLTSVAMASILQVLRTATEEGHRTEADEEIKLTAEWLAASVRGVGGDALSPWMALHVEQDVAMGRTDRVTWAGVDPDQTACRLGAHDGRDGYALDFDAGTAACCLDDELADRQAMLVTPEGEAWRSLQIASVDVDRDGCSVSFSDLGVQPAGSRVASSGLLRANDRLPAVADVDAAFEQATLLVVDVQRLSLDPSTHELRLEEDRAPLDGRLESRVVLDRVHDLQVALGYDCHPRDGRVTNAGDASDEWLGNAPGDALGHQGLTDARSDDLRMVTLGFVHGSPTRGPDANAVRLLDGEVLTTPSVLLRAHTTRVAFRHLVQLR